MAERLLTVDEVAAIMHVSRMTVYRAVRSGELRAKHFGRTIRVPQSALEEYLRESLVNYRQRYVAPPVDL